MLHGPCGVMNPAAPCMKEGKCCKGFPKEFQEETNANVNGYPMYRRRENGVVIRKGRHELDNRFVVPYNAWMCKRYKCHINVEVCSSVAACKYLFKYTYKGHDRATVEVRSNDEVQMYLDTRFIGSCEAAWRIFEFSMSGKSHAITRLQVHLPDQQNVVFDPANPQAALDSVQATTLTAFFRQNQSDPEARTIKYADFPEKYTWKAQAKKWSKRQRAGGNAIGRMYYIPPSRGDVYYLRLVLLHKSGARSFEDMRTHNGVLHATYREVCSAMGLLEGDQEYFSAIQEAETFAVPRALRHLFATILLHAGEIASPIDMWEHFQGSMMEDFVHQGLPDPVNAALRSIQHTLADGGKGLVDFGLPEPPQEDVNNLPREVQDELAYDVQEQAAILQHHVPLLNQKQREFYEWVKSALDEGRAVRGYLDGPAGTGKTFVYEALLAYVRSQGKVALPMAFSGIAATLLPGGRTLHSRTKLPVPIPSSDCKCNVSAQSGLAELLRRADLKLIDEWPMSPGEATNGVDRMCEDIGAVSTFVYGGDFRQVAPILPRGSRAAIAAIAAKTCAAWPEIHVHKLVQNMRAAEDPDYGDYLLGVGDGRLPHVGDGDVCDLVELDERCMYPQGTTIDEALDDLFPTQESLTAVSHAVLCPTNVDAETINDLVMQR